MTNEAEVVKVLALAVRAMNIQEVVDDVEWQTLRKRLIGNWIDNHKHNVNILTEYFNKYPNSPLATRRLLNVLTGSVHRVGHTKGQIETDELRKDVRLRWKTMLGESVEDIRSEV
tara:strand:- start:100 stop:444 length:345 start_codon:yes stop_codon:yes gene_type:complete